MAAASGPAAAAVGGGAPDAERAAGRGGTAGAREAAPLLRGEPAQPVRDADLRGRGLPRSAAAARGRGRVLRGLRRELGGKALPYAWASEWHPGGHGLHVHFAVGRYVRQSLIRDVWGRGIVHIKLIGDLPVGSGALEEARLAAGYLAKYVSKNVGGRAGAGAAPVRGRAGLPAGAGAAARALRGGGRGRGVRADGRRRRGSGARRIRRAGGPPAYWCAWAG